MSGKNSKRSIDSKFKAISLGVMTEVQKREKFGKDAQRSHLDLDTKGVRESGKN
jgi:hypothetical protein